MRPRGNRRTAWTQGLLRVVANAAKIPGGAVVFLDHDDEGFPKQWEVEPLASGTPPPE
jgi:hypothetical protein